MFRAMVEGAEAAVLDMHSQQWDAAQSPGDDGRGAVSASRYMDSLTRRLTHYRCVYEDANTCTLSMNAYVIRYHVPARRRHVERGCDAWNLSHLLFALYPHSWRIGIQWFIMSVYPAH